MAKRESKYAAKLRELGFKQTGENWLPTFMRSLEQILKRPLTRNERRRAQKIVARQPSFTREPEIDPPVTRVQDELGWQWEAEGHIDLAPLGLIDNVAWIEKFFGIKVPKKNVHYH